MEEAASYDSTTKFLVRTLFTLRIFVRLQVLVNWSFKEASEVKKC